MIAQHQGVLSEECLYKVCCHGNIIYLLLERLYLPLKCANPFVLFVQEMPGREGDRGTCQTCDESVRYNINKSDRGSAYFKHHMVKIELRTLYIMLAVY